MKIIIFSFIISLSNIFAQITPLEKSNFSKNTNYGELSEFVHQVDNTSKLVELEIIGKTVENRNIYAVKFSNSTFGEDKSKIKVLIFAQQHGNEQSGKEGSLLLINELLKQENEYLFKKIDLTIIPQVNPDGAEKNQRRNGNSMDLNRNHLILTEPETIALHKFFDKYLFEVAIDVHEYAPFGNEFRKYGYRHNDDIELGVTTNPNIPESIRKFQKEEYLPFIKSKLNDNGFSFFEYSPGGPPEIDYIRHSTFDINDGRQSLGIQNTFSFIQEGLNGKDLFVENIEHRAKGQKTGMFGLLEFAYQNQLRIKNTIKQEREKLIKNEVSENVAIQLDHFSNGTKLELPLLSYSTNKDTIVDVEDYRPIVKSIFDIKRPKGYLIPKSFPELQNWAENHSLIFSEYQFCEKDKIMQYFVTEIDSMDFERDIIINPQVELKQIEMKKFDANYYFIPINQLKNNLIVIALEPKSELGLVTYKQFEHLLKKGETFPILRIEE